MQGNGKRGSERLPSSETISREPLPRSSKVYVDGSLHPIRVGMRSVALGDESGSEGHFPIYDTTGPYTDPDCEIDVRSGLPKLRLPWIEERGDTEQLAAVSSQYAEERLSNPHGFAGRIAPRRATPGKNVTQMYYARQGIVTPEMEYVAIRENQRLEFLKEEQPSLFSQHPGESFGASIPTGRITPEFVRDEVARGRAIIPNNINHPESEPMIIGRNFLVKINACRENFLYDELSTTSP